MLSSRTTRSPPTGGEADIIIVNTCAFIKEAKQESIDAILDLAERKQDARCRTLIVSGCLPQRYQEELARELPGGYLHRHWRLPAHRRNLAEKEHSSEQICYISDPDYIYDESLPRLSSSPGWYSYLKIGEGCSNCCSYCIIRSYAAPTAPVRWEALVAEPRSCREGSRS